MKFAPLSGEYKNNQKMEKMDTQEQQNNVLNENTFDPAQADLDLSLIHI